MSGNVWELCWDWWGDYTSGAKTDPTGAFSFHYRVIRGGGWAESSGWVRSVSRNNVWPHSRSNGIGFRLLRP